MTGLISSFVISPAEPDGTRALLETTFTQGLVRSVSSQKLPDLELMNKRFSIPQSFKVSILPRSEEIAAQLKERAME